MNVELGVVVTLRWTLQVGERSVVSRFRSGVTFIECDLVETPACKGEVLRLPGGTLVSFRL